MMPGTVEAVVRHLFFYDHGHAGGPEHARNHL